MSGTTSPFIGIHLKVIFATGDKGAVAVNRQAGADMAVGHFSYISAGLAVQYCTFFTSSCFQCISQLVIVLAIVVDSIFLLKLYTVRQYGILLCDLCRKRGSRKHRQQHTRGQDACQKLVFHSLALLFYYFDLVLQPVRKGFSLS